MIRFAVAVAGAAALFNVLPAEAGGSAPWCAVHDMGRGDAYWDCQYPTLAQCTPEVLAGNRGFCNPNPAYAAFEPRPPRRHLRRHYW